MRSPHLPDVARAPEIAGLGADRELHLEELRITGRELESRVQHLDGAVRLLHLAQQLRDPQTLLRVARLAAELADVCFGGLRAVTFLLIAAGDLFPRRAVARIALERHPRRRDHAVERRALRLENRRDAEVRAGRVGIDDQRLLRFRARGREPALLALVVAIADAFTDAYRRGDALRDDLGEGRRSARIPVRRGKEARDTGAADVDHLHVSGQGRPVLLEITGDVRVHLQEVRELLRLLIVEQAVAAESGCPERLAQLRLGHHHDLALDELRHADAHGVR